MDAAFWEGFIVAAFVGMVIGNYATNPIYRLPRNDAIFGRKPYCGDCNAPLLPKDLFPILSWLSTRGKCRYCGAKVPGEYTLTEAWTMLVFILAYLKYGFSEIFILTAFGLTAFIMIAMMEVIDAFFSWTVLGWAIAMGTLFSALSFHSMFPALTGIFYSLLGAAAVWKLSPARNGKLPNYVPLAAAVGAWLGSDLKAYAAFLVLLAACRIAGCAFRKLPVSAYAAAALTLMAAASLFY
jgi:prepilin signal peptidase PulO-like enzyme (type II secretory pathway)